MVVMGVSSLNIKYYYFFLISEKAVIIVIMNIEDLKQGTWNIS